LKVERSVFKRPLSRVALSSFDLEPPTVRLFGKNEATDLIDNKGSALGKSGTKPRIGGALVAIATTVIVAGVSVAADQPGDLQTDLKNWQSFREALRWPGAI